MHDLNDTILVQKIRDGSQKAFREIYDRYHVQMYYVAIRYVKHPCIAEDAVQDVFVKFWEKRGSLDETKSVKNYLFTILKNHVLNILRDKKDLISITIIEEKKLTKGNLTEDAMLYKEYHDILKQGMNELSDRKREVFQLRTLSGHTNSEVAEILKINIRTVKTHYYKSSKFMRAYLKKHAGILSVLFVINCLIISFL